MSYQVAYIFGFDMLAKRIYWITLPDIPTATGYHPYGISHTGNHTGYPYWIFLSDIPTGYMLLDNPAV